MKKFLSLLASCLMAGALFAGCGEAPPPPPDDATKIGMISGLNMSEQKIYKLARKTSPDLVDYAFVQFDNLNSMQMSLSSGDIEEMSVYKSLANYITARRPEFEISLKHTTVFNTIDRFACAFRADEEKLFGEFNGAIRSMKEDGTLDTLAKQYITDIKGDEEPAAVEMPRVEGADTVKVAVTGDMPPLDLIKADGTPAGFNTAVLAEISNRINKNFELVSLESAARASALSSGAVDVVFWVRVPNNTELFPDNYDRPDGIDATVPYFKDEIVHVGRK